jgi:two-component system sensor histidine kinase QseC
MNSRALFAGRAGSLRWRLLLLVSVATLLIWAAAGALSYRQARHEVQELMDGQMAQSAALLLAQATHEPDYLDGLAAEMAAMRGVRQRRNQLTLEFRVLRQDGGTVALSEHGPAPAPDAELGYADIAHRGEPWRSLIMETAKGEYRIQVAQSIPLRDKEALEIATKTVLPLGLFIPVLIGLIYFSVRRGLKPLDDLAAEVSARSPENLQTLPAAHVPMEARPLVAALNRLLRRLGTTLENERRFTADAAHELRTPLAAVRVQAQVALASADAGEQRHALRQVLVGTERATRLVEQLLRLARLDPLARLPAPQPVDLAALAQAALDEARTLAPTRDADLHLEIGAAALPVAGDADLLAVVMRNLIDNALRYTAPGCAITVFVRREHGEPALGVADAGAGVPTEELPKLIERFYRGRETTAEGSGLGLAIVRRIAELHGARLEVGNGAAGGFVAQVRWCANHKEAEMPEETPEQ